ncbi:shikimate kinase [Paenibacillus sp. FJAT-26967]|uniref:shikimate kinase n=1 Tax=Paenibacillus sp. FJAT-26967 TaxID=1729690 RepID=UPI00083833AF|nr:shikimate kinase [Paenibacillus sp. FJAT-26967]
MSIDSKTKNLVLIGFMGTGKTTVGLKLAEDLGWRMVDTDEEIVKKAGMSIPDLFAAHGEAYFRSLEREVIEEVLAGRDQVVSTGGGAVLAETNRKIMRNNGFVTALTASVETIVERVQNDQNRPLLQGDVEERVRTMLQLRQDAYSFADLTIDTSSLSVAEIVRCILMEWREDEHEEELLSG